MQPRSMFSPRVIHRHKMGGRTVLRVSELTYVGKVPHAVLRWIDNAGIKVPITVALEAGTIRPAAGRASICFYDGITVDPRDTG